MSELSSRIDRARRTGVLSLTGLGLFEIPAAVTKLNWLRSLDLTGTTLRDLPASLTNLKNLETLNLTGMPLSGFPDVVTRLGSLKNLSLHRTGIVEFPRNMRDFNLNALIFSGGNLSTVPSAVFDITSLRVLDLSENRLLELPPEFGRLEHLSHLFLSGNRFHAIPASLRAASRLQVLDLSSDGRDLRGVDLHSRPFLLDREAISLFRTGESKHREGGLSNLPGWLFESLENIEWISLSGNRIEHIPRVMSRANNLTHLLLSENRVGTFPDEHLPRGITHLDMRGNRISTIPSGVQGLPNLKFLDLSSNPLPFPPEIMQRKHEPQVIAEYVNHVSLNTRPLDEAKLLVVGEGYVGKTSLIKRLVFDQFSRHEAKTPGIDITRWGINVDEITVMLNVWDFGGQEIMHATHQFFLTRRSIYILVVDTRQDEDQNRIEYWLKLIQSFSGGSPVLIVGNKSDESPLDIDQRGLRIKYPDIVAIVETSCREGAGIDALRHIITATVSSLPHVHDLLPESFFAVKEVLEGMASNYITFEEFKTECQSHGVFQKESQELLVGFLHDLGTVLCFRDDPRLASTNILNPAWVTGGVYKILNSNLAAQKKGLLSVDDVSTILDSGEYPAERKFFIIDMMKKFELCYEAEGIFLVPDLLTKEEPDTGVWDDSLKFVIRYDVLPSSVMCRVTVRMNSLISKRTVWRTGVVLLMDTNRALIKADKEDGVLTIYVSGPIPTRRGLLTAVRGELKSIAETIPGMAYEEQVPVPGYRDLTVPYAHLLDLERAGKFTVVPQGLVDEVSVQELLDGIEAVSARDASSLSSTTDLTTDPAASLEAREQNKWAFRQSLTLGALLIVSVLAIFAAATIGKRYLGDSTVPALIAAGVIAIALGMFVLRTSGNVTEQGFLSVLTSILSRRDPPTNGGDSSTQP